MYAIVDTIEVFSDGSGAPAVVTVGNFRYACDFLGQSKLTLLGSKVPRDHRRYADLAREAYLDALFCATDEEWLQANRAMYREDPKRDLNGPDGCAQTPPWES